MISTTEEQLKKLSSPSLKSAYFLMDRVDYFRYDPKDKTTPAGKDVIIGSAGKRFKRLASPLETQVQELQAQVKELQPEETLTGFDLIHDMMKHVATNIQDIGVKPSNSPEINSANIDKFLASVKEGDTPAIYIPYGEYHFARAINFNKRPVYMFGDSGTIFGNSSKLYFPADTEGLVVLREGTSIQETIFERFCVIAKGKASLHDGIAVRARIKMRDVTVKGFAGTGFGIWANLESEGNDASGSILHSCHSLENGKNGFYAGKMDANCIVHINCDARDNGGYGFIDASMLGNVYIGCMNHYNKEGDFAVGDWLNAKPLIIGAYTEGGNKHSGLSPSTTIVGGTWGTPYTIGMDQVGRSGSYIPDMKAYEAKLETIKTAI